MRALLKSFWRIVFVAMVIVLSPLNISANPEQNPDIDFENSDPVEYRAVIMEIYYDQARLIAAEETIFAVDFTLGEMRFLTQVLDAKGKPKPLESFKKGDLILVQGFRHLNGGVVASLIQKLAPGAKH